MPKVIKQLHFTAGEWEGLLNRLITAQLNRLHQAAAEMMVDVGLTGEHPLLQPTPTIHLQPADNRTLQNVAAFVMQMELTELGYELVINHGDKTSLEASSTVDEVPTPTVSQPEAMASAESARETVTSKLVSSFFDLFKDITGQELSAEAMDALADAFTIETEIGQGDFYYILDTMSTMPEVSRKALLAEGINSDFYIHAMEKLDAYIKSMKQIPVEELDSAELVVDIDKTLEQVARVEPVPVEEPANARLFDLFQDTSGITYTLLGSKFANQVEAALPWLLKPQSIHCTEVTNLCKRLVAVYKASEGTDLADAISVLDLVSQLLLIIKASEEPSGEEDRVYKAGLDSFRPADILVVRCLSTLAKVTSMKYAEQLSADLPTIFESAFFRERFYVICLAVEKAYESVELNPQATSVAVTPTADLLDALSRLMRFYRQVLDSKKQTAAE